MSIQIFLDTSDKDQITTESSNPLIKGFTTNPSLMRKAGVVDYKTFCKEVLAVINDKPISFEVFSDDFSVMEKQAREIASWGKNVYVKIPITNSKAESSCLLIKELLSNKIKLNITAVYTIEQVKEASLVLKSETPAIISVFAGRIADTGTDPKPIMAEARKVCNTRPNVQLLWASTREAFNVVEAESLGCDIITIPLDLVKKIQSFGRDLSLLSLETVQTFVRDAKLSGFFLDL